VRDSHVIEYNHFLSRPAGDGNGFETVRIGTSDSASSDSGTIVQHNLFERTNGEIEVISVKSGDNDIRYNTFRQVAGTVTLRHGHGSRITGNFFLGDHVAGTGAIRVMGSRHVIANNYLQELEGRMEGIIVFTCGHADDRPAGNSPVTRVVVAHNTLAYNAKAAFKMDAGCGTLDRTVRPAQVQFLNNLVAENDGPLFAGDAGNQFSLAGNLFSGQASISPRAGVTTLDPKLTLAPDHLWRPDVGSPVINAGVVTGNVSTDMDGQTRDQAPDIGADERSDAPIALRPLVAQDVGPRWTMRSVP
jgi:poly(beta-D-mannuronate) lyase